MENFENEQFRREEPAQEYSHPAQEQPAYRPESDPYRQPYHGAGAGRKESPFANSPYVMNQEQPAYQQHNTYVPPVPLMFVFLQKNENPSHSFVKIGIPH